MNGNWAKLWVYAAAAFGACGIAYAQGLHLKSRNIDTSSGAPESRNRPEELGSVHRIIQLDHFPGVGDLSAILAAGLKVVSVIPDNAVVVSGPRTARLRGARSVGELEPDDKLSPALGDSLPAIPAIVEFHADVPQDVQQPVIAAEGLTFERPPVLLPNHIIVTASPRQLAALARHDEVAYVFPTDPALLAPANTPMPCAGMLTLAGPIAQYANVVAGWSLDSDHRAHLGYTFGALT